MIGAEPTPRSLLFRANLAQLVSPLRRVRSRTPFFRLAAHRIPTLWSLYRGLLQHSPTKHIEFRIRALFRRNQHLTSVNESRKRLEQGYKWLEFFKAATDGNRHCKEVLARYSCLIKYKRNQADLARLFRDELEDRLRMRTRPIYTGGFLRPTMYHGPLPRMKPQPEHISMVIKKRIRARDKRLQFKARLLEDLNDLKLESQFEEGLKNLTNLNFGTNFSSRDVFDEWAEPIEDCLKDIGEKEKREWERASTPYHPEMVEAIFEARREKIRNKTREKERERRGEMTLSAIRRGRKGPPAHVLARMSPERRKMDKVARSLSEVGYVALVKRRLGRKLKDAEAGLELGEKENRALLDKATDMIRKENRRRAENEARLGFDENLSIYYNLSPDTIMRYYEQRYPEVDELVMVQVRQIAEMGAYVKLLEYDNTEGMILLSELSRRRIRSVQKLIRVGRNEVVVVLRVDKEKGYIDLSKRRVSPEDIVKCEERYMKSKAVASILRHVASKVPSMSAAAGDSGAQKENTLAADHPTEKEGKKATRKARQAVAHGEEVTAVDGDLDFATGGNEEEKLEQLYEQIAWPLGKKYGHPYDAFKLALTESDTVFSSLPTPLSPSTLSTLTSTIARRLTPQPIKLRADIELTCYTPAGIDAIKKALRSGEKQSNEAVPIKAKLVAPPLYVLSTNSTDKHAAVDRLERAIDAIQTTIEKYGGNLIVKMKPKAISETEEQDLAQLMAKVGQENAEVSGDEEEEEGV